MKTDDYTEYSRFYDFSTSHQNYKLKEITADDVAKLGRNEGILEVVSDDGEPDEDEDEWVDEDEEEEETESEAQQTIQEDGATKPEGDDTTQITTEKEKTKEDTRVAFRKKKKELKIRRYIVPKIEVLESGEIRLANGTM